MAFPLRLAKYSIKAVLILSLLARAAACDDGNKAMLTFRAKRDLIPPAITYLTRHHLQNYPAFSALHPSQQLSSAVVSYIEESNAYIDKHCSDEMEDNIELPSPPTFDYEAYKGRLTPADNHSIEVTSAALQLNCYAIRRPQEDATKPAYSYFPPLRQVLHLLYPGTITYTNTRAMVQIFPKLSHSVRVYARAVREYIQLNCQNSEQSNRHVVIPPKFHDITRRLKMYQKDLNAINLINKILILQCQ